MNFSTVQAGPCLKSTATNLEIIEAMKNPLNGITFIAAQHNSPTYTFIASDAINWLLLRMEGTTTDRAIQVCVYIYNKISLHRL